MTRHNNWLVSLVVTPRDSAATLQRCLVALHNQTYLDTEIIVVDNFSRDGGAAISRRLADRFVSAGPDHREQRRRGLALARGNVVAFIDPDAFLSSHVVAQARHAFDSQAIDAVTAPEKPCTSRSALGKLRNAANRRRGLRTPPAQFFRTDVLRRISGNANAPRSCANAETTAHLQRSGHVIGSISAPILRAMPARRVHQAPSRSLLATSPPTSPETMASTR